jgi:hypothetical protein
MAQQGFCRVFLLGAFFDWGLGGGGPIPDFFYGLDEFVYLSGGEEGFWALGRSSNQLVFASDTASVTNAFGQPPCWLITLSISLIRRIVSDSATTILW